MARSVPADRLPPATCAYLRGWDDARSGLLPSMRDFEPVPLRGAYAAGYDAVLPRYVGEHRRA